MQHRSEPRTGRHCLEDQTADSGFLESAEVGSHTLSGPSFGSSRILQDKMGANNSSLTPLNCILKNWDRFESQGLKKTHLVFLWDTTWQWYPLGSLAVPATEPDQDYNTAKGRWDQSHFVRCILEGLRQVRSNPLNYGKLLVNP